MDPMVINDERSLTAWLSDKREESAQVIALRAALRVLPYIGVARGSWLESFALLPFGAVLTSWIQLTDSSIDIFESESRANARFGGNAFDFAGYEDSEIAAVAANASYHSAEAQTKSPHVFQDCVQAVDKADSAFQLVIDGRQERGENNDLDNSALWFGVQVDCYQLSEYARAKEASFLALAPLWSSYSSEWTNDWNKLSIRLLAIDPNYSVWVDWYERRIRGELAAFDIPGDIGRKEDRIILRRLAKATDVDFWGKGHEYVNATLKDWLEEARARVAPLDEAKPTDIEALQAALISSASPQARVINNRLDAGPNAVFDKPQYSDNLADLPSELRAFLEVLAKSLPQNASDILRNSIAGYSDELLVRGNQPILNILKGMAASIFAEMWQTPDDADKDNPDAWIPKDAREWDHGTIIMFRTFAKYHLDMIHHFPLDPKREALIAATPVDEAAASERALTDPIDAVTNLIIALNKDEMATDDIVKIVEAHQRYTRDVAGLPRNEVDTNKIVTPKRRHVLMTYGFYLHAYSILGTTAGLSTHPSVIALMAELAKAISTFGGFIL